MYISFLASYFGCFVLFYGFFLSSHRRGTRLGLKRDA